MKDSITYVGGGQVVVAGNDGKRARILPGQIVKRGDIPNDAFDALAIRPDFGGDLDEYRASRAGNTTATIDAELVYTSAPVKEEEE